MPKLPTNKAVTFDNITLYRGISPWANPGYLDGNAWRKIARAQPIVMDTISTLSMHMHGLPWEIRAKDPKQQESLADEIEYHEKILLNAEPGGFEGWLDFISEDLNTLPFGAATETVRYRDGKLYKIIAVDGATFYPVNGIENVVAVQIPPVTNSNGINGVPFSDSELKRIYRWPRPEMERRGWGMTPLERVYLAIEMLSRGDKYYAEQLLNTPEAGILDLGDMSEDSAVKWVESLKLMFSGIDSFRVPVLFEHNTPAKFIPFGKPPSELLYDQMTLKYAQIVVAAWGLTLSDLGINLAASSLAGAIRDERKSKSTGYATQKKLLERHINSFLPPTLYFTFIDVDDERLTNIGRARSANAVAGLNLIKSGAITPKQWQQQLIADKLITIPIDDEEIRDIDEYEIVQELNGGGGAQNSTQTVEGGKRRDINQEKDSVPPSQGGMGEVKRSLDSENTPVPIEGLIREKLNSVLNKPGVDVRLRKLIKSVISATWETIVAMNKINQESHLEILRSELGAYFLGDKNQVENNPVLRTALDIHLKKVDSYFEGKDKWWEIDELDEDELAILAAYVVDGLYTSALKIQGELYEIDVVTDPETHYQPSLDRVLEAEWFNKAGRDFVTYINAGNAYYLRNLAFGVVLDSTVVLSMDSLEENLNAQPLIDALVRDLRDSLGSVFNDRVENIAKVESVRFSHLGELIQHQTVDKDAKKGTLIIEDAICSLCGENHSTGLQPLVFKYLDKFGTEVDVTPFHPGCKCQMRYVYTSSEQPKYYGE